MARARDRGTLVGPAAVAGAGLVLAVVVVRALGSAPVQPTTTPVAAPVTAEELAPRRAILDQIPHEELRMAVEMAPFDPSREAPAARYRLPGERVERVELEAEPARERQPAPAFQLLGTAAGPEGGVAVIRIENGTPQLLSIGQEWQGYRVTSIGGGRVTMAGDDRMLSLSVASPLPAGPAAERGRQGQQQGRQGGNNNSNSNNRPVATPPPGGPMGAMQGRGVTPEQARQIQERLIAAGVQGGQVQVDGNRVIFTRPRNGQQIQVVPPGDGAQRIIQYEVAVPAQTR